MMEVGRLSWKFFRLLKENPRKLEEAFPRPLENSSSTIEEFTCTCTYFNKISTIMELWETNGGGGGERKETVKKKELVAKKERELRKIMKEKTRVSLD